MFKTVIIRVVLICGVVFASQDAPEREIDQGVLRGSYRKTWRGKTFSAFNGIPFAKPPVGDLRFKTAVPGDPWNGVLDASKPHAVCPQIDIFFNDFTVKGDEDCLYLNVYTPQQTKSDKGLLPVLFYIHGGAFMNGCANPVMYGPDILLDKDVVLVTTNYRLGLLGFLSTEDDVVPGNNGLKDQNLALRWTKKNIASFGGDPEKVTIFGQSAGGVSVHYHVLSPLSNGLFQGAIAHSGVAVASWALAPKGQALRNAKRLAEFLNCPTSSNTNMVECLMKVDAYDIVEQDKKFWKYSYDPAMPFKPVIESRAEGAFLTDDPIKLIKSGKTANVPLIIGITTEDGAIKSAALYNNSILIDELDKDFNRIAPLVLFYDEIESGQDYISNKIRNFYFPGGKIDSTTKRELTNMMTDAWFLHSQNVAAELHAKYSKAPVYYFVFGYRGSISLGPLFGDPSHDYGVCHGDELNYLLSSELFGDHVPNESEQKMIDIMTTMWVNFAATANPTPYQDSLIPTKWEPVQGTGLPYYFIKNEQEITMAKNLYKERAEFWKSLPIGTTRHLIKEEL